MKIVFFGSSEFAVPSLEALIKSPHKVLAVVTQPDRKSGRHLILTPTQIKTLADELNLPIYQPENMQSPELITQLEKLKPNLFIVVAFGQILPETILKIPKLYAINLHASLLPRYRGAAPVNWVIIKGEKKTGVTVIKMNKYMDRGDIILQKEIKILDSDTTLSLDKKLAREGAKLLLETVNLIEQNKASFTPQREEESTYAPKLNKKDGLIDWRKTALEINNHIRGVVPWPGAFTYFKGKLLKIWEVEILAGGPGEIGGNIVKVDRKVGIIEVMAKKDRLSLKSLQFEGKNRLTSRDFLLGCDIKVGDILGE